MDSPVWVWTNAIDRDPADATPAKKQIAKTKIDLKVAEDDPDTFEWTSLLLSTEGSANISIPAPLVDMALAMNPQAGAVVGMGFLLKNGDVYEMDAELKKGLLTINGAPIPIPLGAF